MNIYITIKPRANSYELYQRLQSHGANVTDLGDKVYVYTQIDIRDDSIEKILKICEEYGECDVSAHMANKKAPS